MFNRFAALIFSLFAVALVLGFSASSYAETATFSPCANALDGARFRLNAVKILAGPHEGEVLFACGDSESSPTPTTPSAIYSTCFLYNPATNTFTQVASLNIARTLASAIALPDGRVLVAGGFNGANELSSCEIYDPLNNRWTLAAYLVQARSNFTLTTLYTGYILAVGGFSNGNPLASCELYDVTSDTWSMTEPLASARYDHATIALLSGKILVAGGNRSATSPNNTWQIYSPPLTGISANWTPPATLPFSFDSAYRFTSGTLDNGDVVIGTSNSGGRALRFNGTSWVQAGTMQSRWGGSQLRLATNNVAMIGGWGNSTVVDIFLPSSSTWNSFSSVNSHTFSPAILLNNGNVLLCAGNSGGTSEILVPSTVAKPSSVNLKIVTPFGTPEPWNVVSIAIGTTYTARISNTSFAYGGRTYTCVGFTGSGSAPSGGAFSTTFTIEQNSSIIWNWQVTGGTYKLTVVSAHGTPNPAVGINTIQSGTTVNASVDAMVDTGLGIRYLCTGWTGFGSVPQSGSTNSLVFDINMNSTLTWFWTTEYLLTVSNETGLGNPYPQAGANWFTANTVVNGAITSPAGGYQLAGYEGTGSLANDMLPFFSIVLGQPTTINWRWMPLAQNKVSLAVNSRYGSANPSGVNIYNSGTSITASVPQYIESNGIRYENRGWAGAGSVIAVGTTNSTTFTIDTNSIINWNWEIYYLLTIVNIGNLGNPNPPAGSYWHLGGTTISASVTSPVSNYFCTGYTGVGNIGNGSTTTLGFNISEPTTVSWNWVPISAVNTQLLVRSDYGNPAPLIGTSFYFSGAVINALIERTVFGIPGEIFICTGWTGTGSVGFQDTNPETGFTFFKQAGVETNIAFTILNADGGGIPYTNTLTWNWERRYFLTVANQQGMPRSIPADGISTIKANTTVAASVPLYGDLDAGLRAYCIGWTGTGSVSSTGTSNGINFIITAPSSISWLWELRYEMVIDNPAGFGTSTPAPGTYWLPPGSTFSGSISQYYLNHVNQGYILNIGNVETLHDEGNFSLTVNNAALVTWRWDYIPYSWHDPVDVTTEIGEIPYYLDVERSPITSAPWICYQDVTAKDLHIVYFASDHWVNQTLDSFGDVGAFCNMKIDAEGTIRIAYYDETNRTLKFAERVQGIWNLDVVDQFDGNGRYCSINYSPEGKWGIAYLDNSDLAHPKIKYAEKFQNDWLIEVVFEFDGVIEFLSLVYYDNQPLIAFYDASAGKLRYLFYDAEWVIDFIDSMPDVGRYCYAEINPTTGHPGIVYYDLTNNRLKFAQRQNDFTWEIQIVDENGDVGFYPNLNFDSTGKARVTYQDIGRQHLKFAVYDGILWQKTVISNAANSGWLPALTSFESQLSVVYLENNKLRYVSSKPLPTEEQILAKGKGSGCFIATAAFGKMSSDSVLSLTTMRDSYAISSNTGSSLVSLYYACSPDAAKAQATSPALCGFVRGLLDFASR